MKKLLLFFRSKPIKNERNLYSPIFAIFKIKNYVHTRTRHITHRTIRAISIYIQLILQHTTHVGVRNAIE